MGKNLVKIAGPVLAAGLAAGCVTTNQTYNPKDPILQMTVVPVYDILVTAKKEFDKGTINGLVRSPNAVANGGMRVLETIANSGTGNEPRQPGEYNALANSNVVTYAGWGAAGGQIIAGEPALGAGISAGIGFLENLYKSFTQKK